jgi:hypothetical protein
MKFTEDLAKLLPTLVKMVFLSKWTGILKSSELRPGRRCIIIGNGPSFRQSLDRYSGFLQNEELLCVNNFCVSDYYGTRIRPLYYILNAPSYFSPDEELSELYINMNEGTFSALSKKTDWKMFVIVPFAAKRSARFLSLLKQRPNIIPLYYNQQAAEGFFSHFFFRTGLGMPRPHNVLIPSLINLIRIGYKEIFIVGADHSWLAEMSVNEKNEALMNLKHFYDENESRPMKMQDRIVRPRKLHEMIHKFYLSFKGYWEIKDYAEKRGVAIYNSSEVSMIDAFDRRPLPVTNEKISL